MSGWAGFSDAELRRMQQKGLSGKKWKKTDSLGVENTRKQHSAEPAAAVRGRKPPPSGRSRQQLQRERALQLAGSHSLTPGQQLCKPLQKEEPEPTAQSGAPGDGLEALPAARSGAPGGGLEVQHGPADMEPNENHHLEETQLEVKELETQEVELREKSRLEQLQQEQRLMEERNKRKKALLAKTIAEKSKQTQAEAVKLRRVQKELQALDDMVSNDIRILRGKIEEASWDYTAARRRHDKAEAEYVAAKLELQKKTEVKEQLAEHLCAIIQQNELRKAHKLEELMLQLQVTEEEEGLGGGQEEEGGVGGGQEEGRRGKEEAEKRRREEEHASVGGGGQLTEEEEEEGGAADLLLTLS